MKDLDPETKDEEGQAFDVLTALGFGPAGMKLILQRHGALEVLAADEMYRLRVEEGRPIKDARAYFSSILEGPKGSSKSRHAQQQHRWLVSAEDRKAACLSQCCCCVEAAGLMPSFFKATEELAANAGANHGIIDPTLKQLVDDWEEEIDRLISKHLGEPYPRSDFKTRVRTCRAGVDRFRPPARPASARLTR